MNEALFRAVNERVEDLNESFATLTDTFEVVCECGDAGCVAQIRIASDAYERVRAGATLFIVVAGHEKLEIEEIVDRQDAYYIVRRTLRCRSGLPRNGSSTLATSLRARNEIRSPTVAERHSRSFSSG